LVFVQALVVGYLGGKKAVVKIGGAVEPRPAIATLAVIGGGLALLPSFFLAIVVGGSLVGGYGEALSTIMDLGPAGVPFGLAIGIGLVLSSGIALGASVGAAFGKLFYRARPA
jgi:hypothetical protein